jgi:HD-like signal output (HDOD) protein/CheY-like chemotaxis protein
MTAGRLEHILFVDDEPHLLAGLRRMLRAERDHWRLSFATSGTEALQVIADDPVDVIVSDMRMPVMDGAELLARVQREHPSTARIVLSGQADRASVISAIRSAQQFLAKPCDAATLTAAIGRAVDVRRMLIDPDLRRLIGGVSSLPTLPTVYHELVEAMDRPEVDLAAVSEVLASDVATSAEVLKLVNSAFFGLARQISTVDAAVSLLGLDNIQALVLAGSVFRTDSSTGVDVARLRADALRRAAIGRAVAQQEGWPAHERNLAVLACMLRDLGTLVLAEGLPEAAAGLRAALAAEPDADPARRAELEVAAYGCPVPVASAYLLGLWGFAPTVVYTVAGQPLLEPGPATSHFELLLSFADRRVLAPDAPVVMASGGHLSDERLLVWNHLADTVIAG